MRIIHRLTHLLPALCLAALIAPSPSALSLEIANAALAADGNHVVLLVSAGGGVSGGPSVLVLDLTTNQLIEAHTNSAGVPAVGFNVNDAPSISADGAVVALASFADLDLNNPDSNGTSDAYARLVVAEDTRLVSRSSAGVQSTAGGQVPRVSDGGQHVAFQSVASNLDPADNDGGRHDVFVHNLQTSQTTLISVDAAGAQISDAATDPRISADGRFVAFEVFQGAGVGNLLLVNDAQSGLSEVATLDDGGAPLVASQTFISDLSANGQWLTFQTNGVGVAADTNGRRDVYLRDLMAGTTQRVSLATGGVQVTGDSFNSLISDDGQLVAFESNAVDLVAGDGNGTTDLFVQDRGTQVTTRVSVDSMGNEVSDGVFLQGFSANGRLVLMRSRSQVLAPGGEECSGSLACNVYLHDRLTGTTILVPAPDAVLAPVPAPPGQMAGDLFGVSVALSKNDLVVGSPGANGAGGAATVYRLINGVPQLVGNLELPPGFVTNGFGGSVAISGDVLVVGTNGAPAQQKGPLTALTAAIFQRAAGGAWQFKQPLTSAGGGDEFGAAVAVSGNTIVVGAPGDAEGETMGSGAAYVFQRTGDSVNDFLLADKVKPTSAAGGARFGGAVAAGSGMVAVGAPADTPPGSSVNSGSVSIYTALAGALTAQATAAGNASAANDGFGSTVDIGATGTVIVGSPGEDGASGADEGAAYLFGSAGSQIQRLKPTDPVTGGRFGSAVAMDGQLIAVGSPGAQVQNNPVGAIYRYENSGGNVIQVRRRSAKGTQTGYGSAVDVAEDKIAVGAPDSDNDTGQTVVVADPARLFRDSFEG